MYLYAEENTHFRSESYVRFDIHGNCRQNKRTFQIYNRRKEEIQNKRGPKGIIDAIYFPNQGKNKIDDVVHLHMQDQNIRSIYQS